MKKPLIVAFLCCVSCLAQQATREHPCPTGQEMEQVSLKATLSTAFHYAARIPRPEPASSCRAFLRPDIIHRGSQMKHMIGVVQQLKKERERAQQQVRRIDEALAALGSARSTGARTLSAAARRKISLAQKARWAKAKGHAPKPKRTISLAGRKRIAAAQRARWAKVSTSKDKHSRV